jgi:hypothetical protein
LKDKSFQYQIEIWANVNWNGNYLFSSWHGSITAEIGTILCEVEDEIRRIIYSYFSVPMQIFSRPFFQTLKLLIPHKLIISEICLQHI